MNESLLPTESTESRFKLIADPDQPNGVRVVGGDVVLGDGKLELSPVAMEAYLKTLPPEPWI